MFTVCIFCQNQRFQILAIEAVIFTLIRNKLHFKSFFFLKNIIFRIVVVNIYFSSKVIYICTTFFPFIEIHVKNNITLIQGSYLVQYKIARKVIYSNIPNNGRHLYFIITLIILFTNQVRYRLVASWELPTPPLFPLCCREPMP